MVEMISVRRKINLISLNRNVLLVFFMLSRFNVFFISIIMLKVKVDLMV